MDMVTQMPICPWGLHSADPGFISLGKHGNVSMQQPSSAWEFSAVYPSPN